MELTLHEIGKRYGSHWLFRDIHLQIPANGSCAIVGKNGSGKSTLLQILYQYVVPTKGKVTAQLNGTVLPAEQLVQHAGFVSPYLELPEELTLKEMLDFHFSMRKPVGENAKAGLLEGSGLLGNEDKQIRYFSSGMKQRLKLGLAFYTASALLLLDEPTSNLDLSGVAWYQSLVERFQSTRTLIVASNVEAEYAFCQQVIRLDAR